MTDSAMTVPRVLSISKPTPTVKAAETTAKDLRATATGRRDQYAVTLSALYSHGKVSAGSGALISSSRLEGMQAAIAAENDNRSMAIVTALYPPYSA